MFQNLKINFNTLNLCGYDIFMFDSLIFIIYLAKSLITINGNKLVTRSDRTHNIILYLEYLFTKNEE